MKSSKSILVTGANARIGAKLAEKMHAEGFNIIIHYRSNEDQAQKLENKLNQLRANSAKIACADLQTQQECHDLLEQCNSIGKLTGVIHNASSFYKTEITTANDSDWDDLYNSNAKAAYFIAQAAYPQLKQHTGWIINISDINTFKPLKNHSIYCSAKAAQNAITKSLALEMAPNVRVNAIAIGCTIWPEGDNAPDAAEKNAYIASLPLKRMLTPDDVCAAAMFLAEQPTITGQILVVDSGKSLVM
jgi:pteridine reductase